MAGNPLSDPRFAADLADRIERFVGNVRDRTTTPLVHLARALVYGLLAAFLGVTAVVLLVIGATRALQSLLDLAVSKAQAVYLSYLIIGGILCLAGLLVLRMRRTGDA
ncbi:MAG: hypothetical protein ACRDZ2_08995 [Ilumatobacteraceae bacterium]